jgi:hypothetical protein
MRGFMVALCGMAISGMALSLTACSEKKAEVSPEQAASNRDFSEWVAQLPNKLTAPEPTRKSRVQALFQACLVATTANNVVTCRCNVRAITKTYGEPAMGVELDRAWLDITRPFKMAAPEEIAKVQARLAGAGPADAAKQKQVQGIQALCGSPEAL